MLVISPDVFFRSPEEDQIGSSQKLIAMACNSTPNSIEAIAHFVNVIENTNATEQEKYSDYFFDKLESCNSLEFYDPVTKTKAVFQHFFDDYTWNQQAGTLGNGEQQIAPSGEISVLPSDIWDFSENSGMEINGEITFHGTPILHSGEVSFSRSDQQRIWEELSTMSEGPIIASVEKGFISELNALDETAQQAVDILERMFAVDSRYRMIEEIGFAINSSLEIWPGNTAMNEVYGGKSGAIHYGLGLTPYTQYHLDIICPNTRVLANGQKIHGTEMQ